MATWAFHEAKNKLAEVLDRAETEGEQIITWHGREAGAVISAADLRHFRHLRANAKLSAKDFLLMPAPHTERLADPADRRPLSTRSSVDLG